MSTPSIIVEAENYLRDLAVELTTPGRGECLCCYVLRMLDEFRCDGTHRHSLRYRDVVAPRATNLRGRLGRMGACCCDCEILANAYEPRADLLRSRQVDDEGEFFEDSYSADSLPPCEGVRRGTVQPCGIWVRNRARR